MFFSSPDKREMERATAECNFWRERALSLEKELEAERKRNRRREDVLLDRVLVSKGHQPIRKDAERDLNGFQAERPRPTQEELDAIELEKRAFVKSTIASGAASKREAEEYFDTHKDTILNG